MKSDKSFGIGIRFFAVIVCLMLLVNILFTALGGFNSEVSVSSFLNYLSNSPIQNIDFSITSLNIVSDWGIFNFLRNFLNIFANILGFVAWLGLLLTRGVAFVTYIVMFFF